MYKLDKKLYRKYFFYGIENKDEALEGIIYFSYFKDVREKIFQEINKQDSKITSEEIIHQLVDSAANTYQQYYRFVELNYENGVKEYNNEEQTEKMKFLIRNKIEELKNTNEIMTREFVESQIKNAERLQKAEGVEITSEVHNRLSQETIDRLSKVKKISQNEKSIKYSIGQRIRFAQYPEGYFGENQKTIVRNWTEYLYDLLKNLEIMEKEDNLSYKRLWIGTRKKRLENSGKLYSEEVKKEIEQLSKEYKLLKNQEAERGKNNLIKDSNAGVYKKFEMYDNER